MENGELLIGQLFANDNGTVELDNVSLNIGDIYANNGGTVDLDNVCLNVGTNYVIDNGTETWDNVCIEIGTAYGGSLQLDNGANVTMGASKIKIPNGSIWNTNNSELSGVIDAIYILNGNVENFANWTATISDYCVSGNVSVPSTYLPANQNCNAMEDAFDDCNCLDD